MLAARLHERSRFCERFKRLFPLPFPFRHTFSKTVFESESGGAFFLNFVTPGVG
jgi:hypothetical protein